MNADNYQCLEVAFLF